MTSTGKDIEKARVKRLLSADSDMGQLSASALVAIACAAENFVRDIGAQMIAHVSSTSRSTATPVDFKQVVLADNTLSFLHGKMDEIDESDVKYATTRSRRKRKTRAETSNDSAAQVSSASRKTRRKSPVEANTQSVVSVDIDEDDDYDESESDS